MGTVSDREAASRATDVRKTRIADARMNTRATSPMRPNYRLIVWLSALGAVISVFLILVLTERPERVRKASPRPGGESVVAKSAPQSVPQPAARESTPLPPAQSKPPQQAEVPQRAPEPALLFGAGQGHRADALGPGLALPETGFSLPAMPAPQAEAPSEPAAAEAAGPQEQELAASAPMPPLPDRVPDATTTGQPEPQAALPWQSGGSAAQDESREFASLPPAGSARVDLPARSEIRAWARSEAREFVGGVDADGMPLYRFEVWLDAPDDVREQIRSVSYEYRAPSAQPPMQSSSDTGSGFRVRFGAAACAEKAKITVVMRDGQERSADVDGCRILN